MQKKGSLEEMLSADVALHMVNLNKIIVQHISYHIPSLFSFAF